MIATFAVCVGLLGGGEFPDYDKAPYDRARERCMKSGKTLFVLVGSSYCPACPKAHEFVPFFHRRGEYGYIDCQKNAELAEKVTTGERRIPCLVVWQQIKNRIAKNKDAKPTEGSWEKSIYVGPEIEPFIQSQPVDTKQQTKPQATKKIDPAPLPKLEGSK